MLEVLICCSPADRDVAEEIAIRLERGAEVDVLFEDSEGESIATKWEAGLSSAAVVLLLSPESVPPQADRTEWGALLDHAASNAEPPVAVVLVRGCRYPSILERRNFFRWEGGWREALRSIERWALELHAAPRLRSFTPALLPWFEGREKELGALWETLVDEAGTAVVMNEEPASGKTALAQEFCRQAGEHFRQLLWVACGERSAAAIAAEIADQMGVECPGEEDGALDRLLELAGRHRVLLVLDDLPAHLALPAGTHGRASVLVTSRGAQAPEGARIIRVGMDAEPQVQAPGEETDGRLLRAMAVCSRGGFPFWIAARIAGLAPEVAADAGSRLVRNRLADPFDDAAGSMRLNAAAAEIAGQGLEEERRRHARLIHEAFSGWTKTPDFDKHYAVELMPALRWAAQADWPLAVSLGRLGFAFLRQRGRIAEGAELLEKLRGAAEAREDKAVSDECTWELSWIRGEAYRGLGRAPMSGDQLGFDFGG